MSWQKGVEVHQETKMYLLKRIHTKSIPLKSKFLKKFSTVSTQRNLKLPHNVMNTQSFRRLYQIPKLSKHLNLSPSLKMSKIFISTESYPNRKSRRFLNSSITIHNLKAMHQQTFLWLRIYVYMEWHPPNISTAPDHRVCFQPKEE